ncbi:MAG TPA: PilN domain-containing protein [Pilimelia sp.]|nr:PilN domain-containing protein [Pilimelia sp.]
MTTLMSPEATTAAPAPPAPTITANLLPPEIIDARKGRKVRFTVLAAVGGVFLLLAGWFGVALYRTSTAEDRLASTQVEEQNLNNEEKRYGELVRAQQQSGAIEVQLSTLLAGDVRWSALLSAAQSAAPAGVRVTGVTGTLADSTLAGGRGGNPAGNSGGDTGAGQVRLPNTSGKELIGQLTITGTGTDKARVAAYVDALGRVERIANPMLGDATAVSGGVQFTVRVDITKDALSGRYALPSPAVPAGPGADQPTED